MPHLAQETNEPIKSVIHAVYQAATPDRPLPKQVPHVPYFDYQAINDALIKQGEVFYIHLLGDDYKRTGKEDIFTGAITQLSIDRTNNKIVFVDANTDLIRSCDYDGNGGVTLVDLSGYYLYGLSLDSDGNIYLANRNISFNPLVSKYSSTGAFIKDYTTNLSSPEDTVVWEDTVLVANNDASSGYFIIQMDKDLNYITGFGSSDSDGQNPQPSGEFFGPTRFLAVLNRKITLIDTTGTYGHSVVSMDDMSGTGWETYGQSGTAEGEFHFFGFC